MGCWVIKGKPTKSGEPPNITFLLYWKGEKWWEGSDKPYTDTKFLERARKIATAVEDSMRRGMFEADYERFFSNGNRIRRWGRSVNVLDGATSVREFCTALLREREGPLYRRTFGKATKTHLNRWILPNLGHLPIRELRREHVVVMRDKVVKAGRTVKHAKNIVATLQGILTEAEKRKLIKDNPAQGLTWPRRKQRMNIDPFQPEHVENILAAFRKSGDWIYPFMLLLADTGMRPCEAAGLNVSDVDLRGHGRIEIRRSYSDGRLYDEPKTEASNRVLDGLTPRVRSMLMEIIPAGAAPSEPVFVGPTGKRVRQSRVQERKFAPLVEELDCGDRSMYQLRHTFISQGLSSDANQQWLADYTGTSLAMFKNHYGRYLPQAGVNPLAWKTGRPKAKVYQLPRKQPVKSRARKG